jgi:hypothetical protein
MDTQEKFNKKLQRIEAWWNQQNDRPIIEYRRTVDNKPIPADFFKMANKYWPDCQNEPDYPGLVEYVAQYMDSIEFGDTVPIMQHNFGGRGTPVTMACYLGGDVKFGDDTVWVDPVINMWDDFEIKFNPDNIWFKRTLKLLETSCRMLSDKYFVAIPDLGDALTTFSLLRGQEALIFDLMDNKQKILDEINDFTNAWKQYHDACWQICHKYYPGQCTWLGWGPKKNYVVQCDFSVFLSPQMFMEFVIPELESLSGYLDYMVFHLDGPDEIKHLDMLLDLPFMDAIQWVPGAGNPTASHWLDMLKKIQSRQKSVLCLSESPEETKILKKELSPNGLWIWELF